MYFSENIMKSLTICLLLILSACSDLKIENDDSDLVRREEKRDRHIGKIFGDDNLNFGDSPRARPEEPGSSIGVNTYLWRASLDAISFMPLKSVDPFGGVILTDWYAPANTPNERIKIDIRILDRQLRVDGVKVSVFRQKFEAGRWKDMAVELATARKLEDTILTRAREMKVNAGR